MDDAWSTDPEWNAALLSGDDDVAEIPVFGEHHNAAAEYSMKTSFQYNIAAYSTDCK